MKGYWTNHDSVLSRVETKFDRISKVEMVEGVTFTKVMWPKAFSKFKHTANLRGKNGHIYRIEENTTKEHPYAADWAGHVQARIGGLDRYHTYQVWTLLDTATNMYHIVHAEAVPMPLSNDLLDEMVNQDDDYSDPRGVKPSDKEKIRALCTIMETKGAFLEAGDPDARLLIAKIAKCGQYGENLARRIPYFRMRYAPLLFRLWPQSTLMEMNWDAFQKIADNLEDGTINYATLGFSWTAGVAGEYLEALSLHQLKTLQNLTNREDQDVQIVLEFFKRSLDAAKKSQHTYSTLEDLCAIYAGAYVHFATPEAVHNFNTIFELPAKQKFNVAGLHETMKGLLPMALKLGIVKLTLSCGAKPERVIYAMDDWKKQEYLVKFMRRLLNSDKWLSMTDGCKTEADVRAKIAQAARQQRPLPPPKVQGAPHWSKPTFLKIWQRLDDDQQRAVINGILQPISFVGGRPGSGKTEVMMALFHLFGARERVVPLAPYGRIASMLRKRLDGCGYTFHRAAVISTYQSGSPEAVRLKGAATFLGDEYSLQTHHHWYMLLNACGHSVQRMIMFGDHQQMSPIGSGGFAVSIAKHFLDDRSRFVLLRLPHRFVKSELLPKSADDFRWVKPDDPEDRMSIAWNMKTLADDARPDFVYGVDIKNKKATCVLVPRAGPDAANPTATPIQRTVNNVMQRFIPSTLKGTGRAAADAFAAADVQFVTQRNEDRKLINEAVFRYLYGDNLEAVNSLRIGERVTFSRNAYFVSDEDGTRVQVRDRMMESLREDVPPTPAGAAMDIQMLNTVNAWQGGDAGPQPPKSNKRSRVDSNRGKDSDDVFNGELHVITDIVDVNEEGAVVQRYRHLSEKGDYKRGTKGIFRMVIFDNGDKQLNVTDDYDADDITRAYCVTSSKMQGSEATHAIYYISLSKYGELLNTLFKEELYMVLTRGTTSLTIVAGRTADDGLEELKTISRKHAPPHRNEFAMRLLPTQGG